MASKVIGEIVDPNTAGYVLTSNASGPPTFQAAGAATAGLAQIVYVYNQLTNNSTYTTSDRGHLWHNYGTGSTILTYILPSSPTQGDTYYAASTSGTRLNLQTSNTSHTIYISYGASTAGTGHGVYTATNRPNGVYGGWTYIGNNVWYPIDGYMLDWLTY